MAIKFNFKKKSKYNASRVAIDGVTFHSKKEGRRYKELLILQKAGVISDLVLQPKFPFVMGNKKMFTYIADFMYKCQGKEVIEDVKGVRTDVYRLKKKIIEQQFKVEIREIIDQGEDTNYKFLKKL